MYNDNPYIPYSRYYSGLNPLYNPDAAYIRSQLSSLSANPDFNQANSAALPCRMVTNINEAKAAMIDAFNTFVFVDSSNGKIYTKKLQNDGTAAFKTYVIDMEKPDLNQPDSSLESRFAGIESQLKEIKGIIDGSYANHTNGQSFVKSGGIPGKNGAARPDSGESPRNDPR